MPIVERTELMRVAEPDLRHFLESIVVQVNSELAPAEEQRPDEAAIPTDPQEAADREMTETVRSFAGTAVFDGSQGG
jgi:hypothetical protein